MKETTFRIERMGNRGDGIALHDGETYHIPYALPGETAFKLYDTYGFPYDLTEDALRAQGFGIDAEGFDAAMRFLFADLDRHPALHQSHIGAIILIGHPWALQHSPICIL